METLKKMLLPITVSLFFLIFFLPSSADAETFKYVDKNGTIHFTDSYESIPKEYQNQIELLKEPSQRTSAPPSQGEQGPRKGEAAAQEDAQREMKERQELKKREAELRAAQEKETREREGLERKLKARQEKESQIEALRRQIEAKQQEQRTLYTNPLMVRDRNQFTQLNQEINELYRQIQDLQSQIDAEQ